MLVALPRRHREPAQPHSPDEIRCENASYVSTSKIGGCAYWKQPGYLVLSMSDTTITESARFVFDAQEKLLNHPGRLGFPALNRATPALPDHGRGSASGVLKVNWDIRILNAAQNQKVGSMLSALYATERFWYGDHLYVQFTL